MSILSHLNTRRLASYPAVIALSVSFIAAGALTLSLAQAAEPAPPKSATGKPNAGWTTITEDETHIKIETDAVEAVIRKKDRKKWFTGVEGCSFLDKATGFRDGTDGLDIVDWIMEPGSDEAWREQVKPGDRYLFGNDYHGKRPKRIIEGPQLCAGIKALEPEVIRSEGFVAVRMSYRYEYAAPGRKAGSLWSQVIVFPKGKRYFLSMDRIDAVNDSDAMFLRIDMPGHIPHKRMPPLPFSEVYLSYLGGSDGLRIPPEEFMEVFAPDEKFNYRRDTHPVPKRFIRAYHLRDPEAGRQGPWLAGMTLDPADVDEAWCNQRKAHLIMIQEIGGRPIPAGRSFSAAYVVGYFDSIEEMEQVYDRYRGHSGLVADEKGWKLTKRVNEE